LDEQHHVIWHNISDRPFINVEQILTEIAQMKRSDQNEPE
jgi:hypothetical protein